MVGWRGTYRRRGALESGETLENLKERVRAGKDLKQAIEAFSNIDLGPFDSTQL